MFNKFRLLFTVLQNGSELKDKAFWKQTQGVVLPVVTSVLVALVQMAKAFGFDIPLDESTCMYIAGILYGVANIYFTFATSSHVGIPTFSKPVEAPAIVEDVLEQAAPIVDAVAAAEDEAAVQLAKANEWLKRLGK